MTQAEKDAAKAAKEAEKAQKQAEKDAAKAAKGSADELEIEVGDPQLLRPVELPLVVKPAEGQDWRNPEQAEYAKILNAYAYKNPSKWATKRDDRTVGGKVIKGLISQLKEIGEDPSRLQFYKGIDNGISYKNKLIEQ